VVLQPMNNRTQTTAYWRSATCAGETCSLCGAPAEAKVGEEIAHDDPHPMRHNLTAYICAKHFADLMGPAGSRLMMRRPGDT